MKKFLLMLLICFSFIRANEVNKFTQYKPTYVLFGNNRDQVKIQFSFKYQMTSKIPLFLGYTQQMFWDVYNSSDSSPIRETNYNPELFYNWNINKFIIKEIHFVGFEHKSNGQPANDKDRTWDRSGIRLVNEINSKFLDVMFYTKFYYLYNMGSKNNDIQKYLGFSEYRLSLYPKFLKNDITDKEELSVRFVMGEQLYRSAFEYSIKVRIPFDIFSPFIYFQIWDGYGESLVDYDTRYTAYRAGLIFQN